MPAAAVKGIILSISIIAALSVAVLENPQVQAWLEEQRQKIAELLRLIGEELDPQSRRAAEAFASEGQTPATDPGLKRELSGSKEAAAIATGRSISNASTVRRIPIRGPTDPDEAEERRRKGREYLAQRNQQMIELKERRKAARADGVETPPTPTSFDAMVDDAGMLKTLEKGKDKELPSPPSLELVPEQVRAEMREVERNLEMPLLAAEPSSSSMDWRLGAFLANPFGDEYALDRSETPKPPVPPKVALEADEEPRTPTLPGIFARTPTLSSLSTRKPREPPTPARPAMPGAFPRRRSLTEQADEYYDDLSYDEQLAIALSLSEAEAETERTAARQREEEVEDADLRTAILASLKDKNQQSASPAPAADNAQPLVDLTPPTQAPALHQPTPRGHWETIFDQDYSPTQEPLSMVRPATLSPTSGEDDELYRVTPNLTQARLASLNAARAAHPAPPSSATLSSPYDPVREAASQHQQEMLDASFYSAASSAPSPISTRTMDHEPEGSVPQLIDVSEDVPVLPSTFGFQTDSEYGSETFASISPTPSAPSAAPSGAASATHSRAASRPRSEISDIEVIDLVEDSDADIDMLSEEGDGIVTPDSWTEVDSDVDDEHEHEREALMAV